LNRTEWKGLRTEFFVEAEFSESFEVCAPWVDGEVEDVTQSAQRPTESAEFLERF
jgi:hypothetical protein